MKGYSMPLVALLILTMPLGGADPGNYDDHQRIQGPSGIHVWGGTTASLPLGGGHHDVSSWNSNSMTMARDVRINVEYVQGSGEDLGGFGFIACTDRDDDGFCGGDLDQALIAYANEDEGNGCKKDTKSTCDGTDAEMIFCVEPDVPFGSNNNREWDQFSVFIFSWVKESMTGLTGTNPEVVDSGLTYGLFDIYVEYLIFHTDLARCAAQSASP